jgi:hypothetical protein
MVAIMPTARAALAQRSDVFLMSGSLAVGLIALWAFGELIAVNEGFGFGDGRTYGRLGMNLPSFVLGGHLDQYRAARVLPATAVFIANKVLPIQPTIDSTIFLFRLMNVTLLVLAAFSWGCLARRLNLRRVAAWIGFTGVFANFAVLKMALFYPTLTDVPALALTMFLLHAYVSRANWAVGALAGLAAWTMPTVFLLGLVLFLLPRSQSEHRIGDEGVKGSGWLLAALVASAVLMFIHIADARLGDVPIAGAAPVWRSWFSLSAIAATAYVFATLAAPAQALLGRAMNWWQSATTGRSRRSAALRVFVAVDLIVIALMTYKLGKANADHDTGLIALRLVHQAAARPLVFVVAHLLYLGPVVALVALMWRRAIRIVGSLGAGALLSIVGLALLSLSSESRTILAALPFLGLMAAMAINDRSPSGLQLGLFAALSLIVSRFWYPINQGQFETGSRLEFPGQFYFGNFGPWMGSTVFAVFSVIAFLSFGAVVGIFYLGKMSSRV